MTASLINCFYQNKFFVFSGFKNPLYHTLLTKIKNIVDRDTFKNRKIGDNNILRISIQSLGSPIWMAMDCENDTVASDYGQDLIQFMYCLRVVLRDTNAVAFITIPAHLFEARVIY